jgi:hypothetical protein
MKKKEFLTEAKRKAIIAEKEKAIIESFSKTFNKIKRIDENEINKEFNAGDLVIWKPKKSRWNNDYSVRYGAKAKVIEVLGDMLKIEWLKDPSNLDLVGRQMDGNYMKDSFELADVAGVNENDHEDWDLEDRKQQYGINPEIEPEDLNEINDNDDDLYVELDHKDIVSIYLNDESLTFVMSYKIKTDVHYDISKGEPQTYWHPGEPAGLEDVDVNLDVNAMQLDEYDNEIGIVELPDSHYDAIVKAIEEDIEYGYENRKDTLYYKYYEPDGEPDDYDY